MSNPLVYHKGHVYAVKNGAVYPVGNARSFYARKPYNKRNYSFLFTRSFLLFLLGFFVIALLMINYVHTSKGLGNVTFSGFLQWLGSVNTFPLQIDISSYGIAGNWGFFEGLRLFFDTFAKLFGVAIYLGANVINVLIFFAQFLVFIFGA